MNTFNIGNLESRLPIIQGGMGVAISLSGLASAVANAGGIGVISAALIGMREPDYKKNYTEANKRALRDEIRKARNMSKGVIGVNMMMVLTDHEELIRTAISEKIDLIILGAGLPLKIPAIVNQMGYSNDITKLAIKVSSAKAAKLIFQYWSNKYNMLPDAVVVEGPLAGGHLGFKKEELTGDVIPLHKLLSETKELIEPFEKKYAKKIPVIAAGGIYDGKDMFNIMQSGADAVKLGTRFVTTHECDASQAFKETYIKSKKEDVTIIDSPVGLPGRVIKTPFVEQILAGKTKPFKCAWHCLSTCDYKNVSYCIAQALANAANGNMEEGFAFSGTNAYKANKIQSVEEVFQELLQEYQYCEIQALSKVPVIRG